MARTKEEYETMGMNDAICVHGGATWASLGRTMTKDAGSWQARAYWAAYEEREAFLQLAQDSKPRAKRPVSAFKKPPPISSIPVGHPFHQNFAGWDRAALEHVRSLAHEFAGNPEGPRAERLMRSFNRVSKRQLQKTGKSLVGVQARLGVLDTIADRDFPVSTQPHPDGPITVGMLLSGQ